MLALSAAACVPDPSRSLPPDEQIRNAMAQVLADTGAFAEVTMTRVVGRHYLPGDDRWNIIACYRFTAANGAAGEECGDSFLLSGMDNGRWVLSVSYNGAYRWRELNLLAAPTAPRQPGTDG